MVKIFSEIRPIYLAVIITMWLTSSCEEKIFVASVDCDECYLQEPREVDLKIDLTINQVYDSVVVELYYGKVAESTYHEYYENVTESPIYLVVEPRKEYSAVVTYIDTKRKVKVVDGTEIKLKYVSSACTDPCWVIEGAYIDLRLQY